MSDINVLSPHVADLIAAGEVVEKPASVIKELLENAFDANAANITVELRDGGLTYIRVTDDGTGMLPEDAGVCFLRHATSKLRDEKGLERIETMGFRGEALAAIAAVSKIELITRKQGSDAGTRVLVNAGDIAEIGSFGAPVGTSITVRDLFHNTPARLKFMKSDRAEASACIGIALRCALGHPGVSVRLIRDGKEEFFSPGDGKRDSAVYSLLGRELSGSLVSCQSVGEDMTVGGFVGRPNSGHGNRSKQFFFCNDRAIRSPLLQSAVEQAYKNSLLSGRFPACVIWLDISPAAVDVNVHPTKTEVRFRDERKVFDAVYYAALSALREEGGSPEIKLSPSTKAALAPKKDFFKSMTASEYREKQSSGAPKAGEKSGFDSGTIIIDRRPTGDGKILRDGLSPYITRQETQTSAPKPPQTADGIAVPLRGIDAPVEQVHIPEMFSASGQGGGFAVKSVGEESRLPSQSASDGSVAESAPLPLSWRLIGEAMKTYIIAEIDDKLLLIDKHAAHERMIFDRLKRQNSEMMSQTLLAPITVKMTGYDVELVEKNAEKLSRMGLELEPFGEDSLVLRGVPADTDALDAPALVEEICEKLRNGSLSDSDAVDEILHVIACKAAIKAGWSTSNSEREELVRAVVSGEVKYCPHGRPVSVTLTKKQLDKEFSRIV